MVFALPWACGSFDDYRIKRARTDGKDAAAEASGAGGSTVEAGSGGAAAGSDARTSGGSDTGTPDTGVPGCGADADCVGSVIGPVCNSATRACVQCLPGGTACGAGLYCTTANQCAIGCAVDLDCVGVASGPGNEGGVEAGVAADSGGDGATPSPSDAGGRPDASRRDAGRDASRDATADGARRDASLDAAGREGGRDGSGGVRCDTVAHACVGCTADADCPLGTVCEPGAARCIPGCTPSRACPAGLECCSGECADLGRTPSHCGACGNACDIPGSVAACVAGSCQFASCQTGFPDCNDDTSDGCEAELASDPANCNACGRACAALPNADPGCTAGQCGLGPCQAGFEDCEGDPSNGCETNLETNAASCGGCGFVCDLLNASESCVAGECQIANCTAGYEDCNKDPADGCEVNRLGDAANCGTCGNVCVFTNAAARCDDGVCRIDTCLAPRGDCNGDPTDGCETNRNLDV